MYRFGESAKAAAALKKFPKSLIGATWTSYLSTIGFSSGPKKADEIIEAGLKGFAEKFVALKKEIMNIIAQEAAKAENVVKTEKVEQPYNADEVSRIITDKIDLAGIDLQKDMNLTRQMVRREMKRILWLDFAYRYVQMLTTPAYNTGFAAHCSSKWFDTSQIPKPLYAIMGLHLQLNKKYNS